MGHKKRANERDRTSDLLITNQLLYQLSYVGQNNTSKLIESGPPVKEAQITVENSPDSHKIALCWY